MNTELPSHPVWTFSLQIYGHEGVKAACLGLQNRHDLNVNLLLFCCWLASTGQGRLEIKEFSKIFYVIDRWHNKITKRIRNIRNRVSGFGNPEWSKTIRKLVLSDELAAEQVEQLLLADTIVRLPIEGRSLLLKATDAVSSFSAYGKLKKIKFDTRDYAAFHQLLSAVFPKISSKDLALLCRPLVPTRAKEAIIL